eukprot:TRINITY_DN5399_c0_g1_i1.p1 TRINITY_DN5399_c0_g1~~TRINITY_DN5399_c0_g1_i1.p1  ORF type:complete len:621 (-),score=139.30 TRINITY_DN5399_c0_g1_i1:900-2702(-)
MEDLNPYEALTAQQKATLTHLISKRIEIVAGLQDEKLMELIMMFLSNEMPRNELKQELEEYLKPHHDGIVDWIWVTMAAMASRGQVATTQEAMMPQENPWDMFKRVLSHNFVAYCAGKDIDWQLEKSKLRQCGVSGMAMNSPDPAPPSSPDYPPLLIMQQMLAWLRYMKIGGEDTLDLVNLPLLIKEPAFADYFVSSLHLLGFIISTMRDQAEGYSDDEEGDEDDASEEEVEEKEQNVVPAETELITSSESAEPQGEEELTATELEHVSAMNEHLSVDQMAEYAEMQDAVDETFLLPLAEPSAEVLMRLIGGLAHLLPTPDNGPQTGTSLYSKYKSMTVSPSSGTDEDDETPVTAASVQTESLEMLFSMLAPPFQEIFAPGLVGRDFLRKHPDWEKAQLLRTQPPRIAMLYDLVSTLDEEWLLIHLGERKAFRCQVTGCSDNKLLGIAIGTALLGEEDGEGALLKGKPVPQALVDMLDNNFPQEPVDFEGDYALPFSMSIWPAIKPTGKAPSGMAGASLWLFTEGVPAQVPKWNGKRVLVLGKAPFAKRFEPVRMFGGMTASVVIDELMEGEAFDQLIKQIAASPASERKAAVAAHKGFK